MPRRASKKGFSVPILLIVIFKYLLRLNGGRSAVDGSGFDIIKQCITTFYDDQMVVEIRLIACSSRVGG